MRVFEIIRQVRRHLEENGRVSLRLLRREFALDDDTLAEVVEELVDVQRVARREESVLVWSGQATPDTVAHTSRLPPPSPPERHPPAHTPQHLADTVADSSAARPADRAEAHGAGARAADARKVVTILFADLAGSTALHERLDPEAVRLFMESYYRTMRGAVGIHGGTVVKLLGDGVMAAFGVPRVAEDDAMRALRAGIGMQHAFRELARKHFAAVGDIGLRVAINTGEVVVSADNTDVVGDPVNVAARLQQEAHDGDVLLGEPTRRLVAALVTLEPLGNFALKGRAETVKAYRVVSLDRPAGAATAAFVGRGEELARIAAVYDAAVAKPAARLAVLLGSPGLGKSRLIEEFIERHGDAASVLTAQCDAAGGATFAPLAEALREFLHAEEGRIPLVTKEGAGEVGEPPAKPPPSPLLGKKGESARSAIDAALPPTETERARIVAGIAALLAGSPASPEETFFVIRRLLSGLATAKPVVLIIDDLQWAEPLLLDLVEHLVQWGSGVPLLVLVAARPELRDLRSSLVTPGGLVSDVITLSGLDAGAAMRLAASVIGAADLPAVVAAKVLATSEGNPLFVGELVRMLVDEGAIERQGQRWIVGANLAALEMPPTIHALLAARIERLRPEERAVLECAAVVGRHFSRSAVAALLGRNGSELDARLEALRRTELIERDSGWFLGEPLLRFHHVLIRDAAYRRLLKGTRAELHERLADWIEAQVEDAAEHDETIGWHLEQAHQHLRELGPLDAKGTGLGERAAGRLAAAGRRALARDDAPPAASLLGRAIDRLDANNPARAELALDWCEALLSAGDVGPAAKAIDELGRLVGGSTSGSLPLEQGGQEGFVNGPSDQIPLDPPFSKGEADRLSAWHTCFAAQLAVLTDPASLHTSADAVAHAAAELEKLGDAAGEAKAHSVHAQALARLGKVGACEATLDKALAAARKAGHRRRANAVLAGAPLAALWGPSPVTRASGRCLDVVRVLRITQGAPAVEAVALSCQGVLEALRGRTDAARRMIASSRKMVEELGIAHRLFEADVFAGRIDLLEGHAVAAERNLRGAYRGLRDLGLGIDAARAGALLARALLAQGKVAEAETASHESEATAGDDLQAAIAWRGVRAEALASRGETQAAVELAQSAVAIASATDALLDHADARLALAATLRSAGRRNEANAEERHAIELWEAKGATLLAERASSKPVPRRTLGKSEPSDSPGSASDIRPGSAQTTSLQPVRRVRANAATAFQARIDAAIKTRDLQSITDACADDVEVIIHPAGGLTYGRREGVERFRLLFQTTELSVEAEPLATLGDSLILLRDTTSFSALNEQDLAYGPSRSSYLNLADVNERQQLRRLEIFTEDRLGNAIARLYKRYAKLLPDGPERERAAATARSIAAMAAPPDMDRYASALAPDVDFADHRTVGFASGRGADKLLRGFGSLLDLAEDVATRVDDVLALEPGAMLLRWTTSGTDRAGGGAFESPFLLLWKFGDHGLVVRDETFDAHRVDEALARFDELVGDTVVEPTADTAAPPLANAATRAGNRLHAAWEARDWEAEATPTETAPTYLENAATRSMAYHERRWAARDWNARVSGYLPTYQLDDRRSLMHMQISGEAFFSQLRMLFETPRSRWHFTPLATRGEHLALGRVIWEGDVDDRGGPLAAEYLEVFEVDDAGRCAASVLFDPGALDTAYAELDARHEALCTSAVLGPLAAAPARLEERHPDPLRIPPNAATRVRDQVNAAFMSKKWDAMQALASDGLVFEDRRAFSLTSGGVEMWIKSSQFVQSASGVAFNDEVIATVGDRIELRRRDVTGTGPDGGAFESEFIVLTEVDVDGRLVASINFDLEAGADAFADARARFSAARDKRAEGLATAATRTVGRPAAPPDPLRIPPNAATRAGDRIIAYADAGDWEALRACCAPIIFEDRRRLFRTTGDCTQFVANCRFVWESGMRPTRTIVATAGNRLDLHLMLFSAGEHGHVSEVETLEVFEVDADGRILSAVIFDPADRAAASTELFERYAASGADGAPPETIEGIRAWNAHDLERVRALLPDDFYLNDHRRTGVGRLNGADAYLASIAAMYEISSDLRVDALYNVSIAEHGIVYVARWSGANTEGGEFDAVYVCLGLLRNRRPAGLEIFELEQLDAALARFEALRVELT